MPYSIDTVSKLTGLSTHTLRNWEKRYAFLNPQRQENGFRAYSDEQVDLLRRISALIQEGARIGDLAEMVRRGQPLPEPQEMGPGPELRAQIDEIYSGLVKFDQVRAAYLISVLSAKLSTPQMLEFIYYRLLVRLGEDWANGTICVAQEHFASAFLRARLVPYLSLPVQRPGSSTKVVCATVENELHEGGLLLLSAYLKLRGWDVFYLGAHAPLSEIWACAKEIEPAAICLSFSDPALLKASIAKFGESSIPVVVGGLAVPLMDGANPLPSHVHLLEQGGYAAVDYLEKIASSQSVA